MIARTPRHPLAILLTSLLLSGCAAKLAAEPPPQLAPAPEPILTRSLYSKDPTGALTEDSLQTILARPIDLQLPARIGVVPLAEPFDPEKPAWIRIRSVAARHLARKLRGSPYFSHVSDITTELPRPGGIEGLRVLAARYRVRYLLLYSERFEDDSHPNGWAFLYPTLLGLLVAPGQTVESHGLAQIDMLDVRTGTILFTLVEPMHASSQQLLVNASRARGEQRATQAITAAEKLAKGAVSATADLVAFAERHATGERRVRSLLLPSPIASAPEKGQPQVIGEPLAAPRP